MTEPKESLSLLKLSVGGCGLIYGRDPCQAVKLGDVIGSGYQEFFNGTDGGWTSINMSVTPGLGGVTITGTGSDQIFRSGTISVSGAVDKYVEIEVTRLVAGSTWDGKLFYITSGGHGESGSFYKLIAATDPFPVGERVKITLDMSALTLGGTDWITSTITGIRLDFDQTGTGSFVVHSVKVGHLASASESTGDDKCFNTRATCQDLTHFDSIARPIDAGLGAKIEAFKTNPVSANFNLAGRSFGAVAGEGESRTLVIVLNADRAAGAASLTLATVGGETCTIRSQITSGRDTTVIIETDVDPAGTSGTIHLEWSGAVDYLGMTSYRLINAVYEAQSTVASIPNPSLDIGPLSRNDFIIAGVTSQLLSTTSWAGITEDTDDVNGNQHWSTGSFHYELTPDSNPVWAVTATMTYADVATPTVVASGQAFDGTMSVSGIAVDDVIFIALESDNGSPVTPPNGEWTALVGSPYDHPSANRISVFWSRRTTTANISAIQWIATNHVMGCWIQVRGVPNTGTPWTIGAFGGYVGTTAVSIAGLTTTINNALVADFVTEWDDSLGSHFSGYTNASLTSLTEREDGSTNTGNGGGVGIATGIRAAAGAVSATTVTATPATMGTHVKIAIYPRYLSDSTAALAAVRYTWTPVEVGTEYDLMFSKPSDYRPQDVDVIPSISDIKFTSARLAPGDDLGTRSKLDLSFIDHPHPDTGDGLDKYFAERSYNPYLQGSFWPKFRARQPYLRGRDIVWYNGEVGQTLEEMEARYLVVENFNGPTEDGVFSISALDPLKMLDGDRAQCPVLSEGRLSVDIDNAVTSFTITPSGIGSTYYTSGYVSLGGSESVSYTRVGDVFTIVRAQLNSDAKEHKAQDRVQQIEVFDSMKASDIINRLMTVFAYIPQDWVPVTEWNAEDDAYLRRVFTGYVAEPTAVNKLVAELMQQCGLSVWWDMIARLMRFRVLRQITTATDFYDETVYNKDTFKIREQQDKRISQVWTFYGQVNPLLNLDDRYNYRSSVLTVDLEATANYGQSSIKKIYSRWIAQGGRTTAERVNSLQISRYRVPPRMFSFSLTRDAQNNPELGAGYQLSHRVIQNANGSLAVVPCQAVSVGVGPDKYRMELEEFNYAAASEEDLSNRTVTLDASTYDADCRSLHDDIYGDLRTGDTVTIRVEGLVIVGSTSAATPALSIGSWPTLARTGTKASTGNGIITGLSTTADLVVGLRVTGTGIQKGAKIASIDSGTQITLDKNSSSTGSTSLTFCLVNVILEVLGMIQGAGGPGGKGANDNHDSGSGGKNGTKGGTGLYSRYPFTLIDASSLGINGGGGGGAGGSCANFEDHRGGGGGGGAGSIAGAGGVGPQQGEDGQNGTLTTGGAYGRSYTSSNFWTGPSLRANVHGGAGGTPGVAGDDDAGGYDIPGGSPGAGGNSIDGDTYTNTLGSAGTRLGTAIN